MARGPMFSPAGEDVIVDRAVGMMARGFGRAGWMIVALLSLGCSSGSGGTGVHGGASGGAEVTGGSGIGSAAGAGGTVDNGGSGGGAGDLFAVESFSMRYGAEIEADCRESVLCNEADTATADSIPNCVSASAEILDADAQKQDEFLQRYGSCKCFQACEYYNCAGRPTLSFGEMQIDNVRLVCTAKVACATSRGGSLTACECEQEWINRLDVSVPAQRDAWEAALTMCAGMAECAFSDCFDAAYGVTNP